MMARATPLLVLLGLLALARCNAVDAAEAYMLEVLQIVNDYRASKGSGPLCLQDQLTAVAVAHSQDQASHQSLSHTGSDGSSPFDRMKRAGYPSSAEGENVAFEFTGTARQVMDMWLKSPGHEANIRNAAYKHIGIGKVVASNGASYWTQDFGSAGSATCSTNGGAAPPPAPSPTNAPTPTNQPGPVNPPSPAPQNPSPSPAPQNPSPNPAPQNPQPSPAPQNPPPANPAPTGAPAPKPTAQPPRLPRRRRPARKLRSEQ